LPACVSLAPEPREPEAVAQIPSEFAPNLPSGDYQPQKWWTAFEDPVLNSFVDQALANNLDIAEAAGRLEQASAQARIARAGLLPSVNATADGSFSSTPVDGLAFGDIAGGVIDRIENENYSAR